MAAAFEQVLTEVAEHTTREKNAVHNNSSVSYFCSVLLFDNFVVIILLFSCRICSCTVASARTPLFFLFDILLKLFRPMIFVSFLCNKPTFRSQKLLV